MCEVKAESYFKLPDCTESAINA